VLDVDIFKSESSHLQSLRNMCLVFEVESNLLRAQKYQRFILMFFYYAFGSIMVVLLIVLDEFQQDFFLNLIDTIY
jgi:hypothetical protein